MTSAAQSRVRAARPVVLIGALFMAGLLNVALIQSILFLNRAAAARAPEIAAEFRAQVMELPPVQEVDPVEDVEVQDEVEPLMQVDLDAAAPELDELELPELSFDLQLSSTSLGSTSVQVQSRVAVHEQPTGQPQTSAAPAQGPMDSDRVDQPPRELSSSPKPTYPRAAQRRRIEGLVSVELLIDEKGRVRECRNERGDPMLVRAVLEVAPKLRFAPAKHQGQLVSVWGRKTFRFQIPTNR